MALRNWSLSKFIPAIKYAANGGWDVVYSDGVPTESGAPKGALAVDYTNGNLYINQGTVATASWVLFSALGATIGASEISDGAITPAKLAASEALTATADGLTTGLMTGTASHAVVTSASATNAITLPASAATLVGKQFTIWVGSNGFELLTPAASGATINNVDSDGTNQADIAANTLSRLTLVTTNTWILESLTNLGAVATAIIPDND